MYLWGPRRKRNGALLTYFCYYVQFLGSLLGALTGPRFGGALGNCLVYLFVEPAPSISQFLFLPLLLHLMYPESMENQSVLTHKSYKLNICFDGAKMEASVWPCFAQSVSHALPRTLFLSTGLYSSFSHALSLSPSLSIYLSLHCLQWSHFKLMMPGTGVWFKANSQTVQHTLVFSAID